LKDFTPSSVFRVIFVDTILITKVNESRNRMIILRDDGLSGFAIRVGLKKESKKEEKVKDCVLETQKKKRPSKNQTRKDT
jgi:hypothetical protein